MQLEDKITLAVAGPIKAGKEIFVAQAEKYKDILFHCLDGNYWVPQKLSVVNKKQDRELFERYSAHPHAYAFEFQIQNIASRLEQQNKVDYASGIVLLGQPLEIDHRVYAEANRENIGASFPTYGALYEQVKKRVASPHLWIYLRVQDVEVLKRRIAKRGFPGEQKFLGDDSYLRRNIELNERFFSEVPLPVIRIDATPSVFDESDGGDNAAYFKNLFADIAANVRRSKPPLRLSLNEWLAMDYNRGKKAAKSAHAQLQQYLREYLTIITLVGNVGVGKTGLAELLEDELGIDILKELEGSNDTVGDELLSKFLRDKPRYGYDLQKYLLPRRLERRKRQHRQGRSFVEDRSPVEDQSIFWRRFHQQGFLSDEQLQGLQMLAKAAYKDAPASTLMIKLHRPYTRCRQMILQRGRSEEIAAWTEQELQQLEELYNNFLEDMVQYGSHHGPMLEWDLEELQPEHAIHQGFMFQEMHHRLLEWREDRK